MTYAIVHIVKIMSMKSKQPLLKLLNFFFR